MLLLDGGNLLFSNQSRAGKKSDVSLIVAHGILRAYKLMGYDAIGVSSHDLQAGYAFFKNGYLSDFPLVSANVYDNSGQHVFKPHILTTLGDVTIGIIGITGPGLKKLDNLVIKDWHESVGRSLNLIRPLCDIVIIISSLSEKENGSLQNLFPARDIIITAQSRSTDLPTKIMGQAIVTQSGNRGKYFGQLDIKWHGGGHWGDKRPSKLEGLENKLKTIEWYIEEFSKQQPRPTTSTGDERLSKLKTTRNQLTQQIASLRIETEHIKRQDTNSFQSRIIPVQPSDSPAIIEGIVTEITESINSFNKQKQLKRQTSHNSADKEILSDSIAGYKVCSSCHEKQYLFWKNTQHATSFETLIHRGQAYNLSCLPCHVTGGLITAASAEEVREHLLSFGEERKTVGCEACHGPAQLHAKFPTQTIPKSNLSQTVCITCHTSERDYNFNYSDKLVKVRCPSD